MGREVRMVPPGWQHPTEWGKDYKTGRPELRFKPLFKGPWSKRAAEWDDENAQWERGFEKECAKYPEFRWVPKAADRPERFEDWDGPRPKQEDYMPEWPESEATHLVMYENTSEGTPISPAFATPEELARWLADNGANTFGSRTGTYEQWLPVCLGGWAPSAIIDAKGLRSGVEAMADLPDQK